MATFALFAVHLTPELPDDIERNLEITAPSSEEAIEKAIEIARKKHPGLCFSVTGIEPRTESQPTITDAEGANPDLIPEKYRPRRSHPQRQTHVAILQDLGADLTTEIAFVGTTEASLKESISSWMRETPTIQDNPFSIFDPDDDIIDAYLEGNPSQFLNFATTLPVTEQTPQPDTHIAALTVDHDNITLLATQTRSSLSLAIARAIRSKAESGSLAADMRDSELIDKLLKDETITLSIGTNRLDIPTPSTQSPAAEEATPAETPVNPLLVGIIDLACTIATRLAPDNQEQKATPSCTKQTSRSGEQ